MGGLGGNAVICKTINEGYNVKFQKGNTFSRGPRKPGGGKKKSLKTLMKEAYDKLDESLPDLFQKLIDKAKGGDKDCLQYLIDRKLGRPHQSQDLRVTARREYSPEELQLMSIPLLNEAKKLKEWSEDATKQSEKQGENEENQVAQANCYTAGD